MEISVSVQLYVFLMMVLLGMTGGILFDLTRIWRSVFGGGFILTGVLDFLFWIIFGVLSFGLLFYVNSGELRWYEFLGVILGALIYFLALSRAFRWITGHILRICVKILAIFLKILLTPIKFLYKILSRWIYWGLGFVKKPLRRIRRGVLTASSRMRLKVKNILKVASKE